MVARVGATFFILAYRFLSPLQLDDHVHVLCWFLA